MAEKELDIVEQVKAEIASRAAAAEELPEPEYEPAAAVPNPTEPAVSPTPAASSPPPPEAPAKPAAAAPQEPEPTAWIDDDALGVAALLGIPEAELADYEDRADFDRATRIAARSLTRSADGAAAAGPPAQPAPSSSPPPAAPAAPAQPAAPAPAVESMVEELKKAGYDDPVILKMGERLDRQNEQLARQTAEQTAREQQQAQSQQREVARAALHSLSELDAERYGKRFDEQGNLLPVSQEAVARAERTLQMAEVLYQQAVRNKRPLPPIPTLMRLADNAAFAAENVARAKAGAEQGMFDKLHKQSKKRLGGSARVAPVATPFQGPISENPELISAVEDIIANPA